MSLDDEKPSNEALQDLTILGIIFASADKVTSGDIASGKHKNDFEIKCSFCNNICHSDNECGKKKEGQNKNSGETKILFVNNPSNTSYYQLDTAAGSHVSGNIDDFSSYTRSSQSIVMAGGGQITTNSHGDMILPTLNGKLEFLTGVIHLPVETTRMLSTSQLEKQGFYYQNIELLRLDGLICAHFWREAEKLV
ncbi:hypothetical protein EPUL_000486 [Erysiphe pulchra]|uniref:Retrovirus-related Pol polyprotein from transposon TNT 1-94-like beta-barrel domain-containing protein n=1 Tax=Erysiphe pulchra TaxID=225359 RepID=A0A2S4Q191_9PEZI|nr:hypothetical protein EPUL_000486 [Erysiphe pulchra]